MNETGDMEMEVDEEEEEEEDRAINDIAGNKGHITKINILFSSVFIIFMALCTFEHVHDTGNGILWTCIHFR